MTKTEVRAVLKTVARVLGRSKPVLSPYEKRVLMRVETTAEDAEMIVERNVPLLQALRAHKSYAGNVGCPHCNSRYDCTSCAWRVRPFSSKRQTNLFCAVARFGGVTLYELAWHGLSYSDASEGVDEYSARNNGMRSEISRFLRGHLEWAADVLRAELRRMT